MYGKKIFLLSLWLSTTYGESTYPSIVWNPWNPLFACDNPKINVRIGDIINFLCPSDEFTFYVPSSSVMLTYENLYFLGSNKGQYESCNATGMRKLLNCNGIDPKHKTLTFRDVAISRDSIVFTKGKTYYFIGTGFRTKDNLKNVMNGSCMNTDEYGVYKLRLRVYVCTDADAGCHICKTAGCYYKNCDITKCTSWTSDGIIYRNLSHCLKIEARSCTNTLIGNSYNQTRYSDTNCPSEGYNNYTYNYTGPNKEFLKYQGGEGVSDDKFVLINGLTVAVVLAFILGVALGALAVKYCDNNKHLLEAENKVNLEPSGTVTNFSSFDASGAFDNLGKDEVEAS